MASGPGLRRLGSWMGIAFVVLFVAGFLLFNVPNKGTDTAKWANWWNDSGHRTTAVIAAYLTVLGLLAFVWFAASLRERFQTGGGLLFTFASIFATVGLVSTLVRATIPGNKTFGGSNGTPVPQGADLARQLDGLGFGILGVHLPGVEPGSPRRRAAGMAHGGRLCRGGAATSRRVLLPVRAGGAVGADCCHPAGPPATSGC
jgi:hypothetical protein